MRLNSGSRFVVPRKLADAESFSICSVSCGGGGGGSRLGVLGSLPLGGFSGAELFWSLELPDSCLQGEENDGYLERLRALICILRSDEDVRVKWAILQGLSVPASAFLGSDINLITFE